VAITDFNSAHQLDAENMEVLFNRGLCLQTLEDFGAAEKDFREVVAVLPDMEDAWFNLAYCLLQLHEYTESAELFGQVLLLNPDAGDAYYNRGLAHYYLYEDGAACDDWTRAQSMGVEIDQQQLQQVCGQ